MTDHIQEHFEAETLQEDTQLVVDAQSDEIQPIECDKIQSVECGDIQIVECDEIQSVECNDIQIVESEFIEETTVDYDGLTREEIVDHFRKLLDNDEIDTIRKEFDAIKFHFYRSLKAEEELKRAEYLENGGSDEDFVFEDIHETCVEKSACQVS